MLSDYIGARTITAFDLAVSPTGMILFTIWWDDDYYVMMMDPRDAFNVATSLLKLSQAKPALNKEGML